MENYEIHITCMVSQAEAAQKVADEQRWKTSQISRDITLGDDTYFYLTTHTISQETAFRRLNSTVAELEWADVKVIRQKIEHIIFDTKAYKS